MYFCCLAYEVQYLVRLEFYAIVHDMYLLAMSGMYIHVEAINVLKFLVCNEDTFMLFV